MSTAMDLRISADADIKRLREMVQKLEDKNATVKTPESPRLGREPSSPIAKYKREKMSSSPVLERVAVKLHLDDVPLMNLSEEDSEEEDSWLYMSPIHPPTPAQKSVSPYKYLKQSIDHQNDLNKVRGSLMAKLESIAAQEESLSISPPKETSSSGINRTFILDEKPKRHDYDDELEALEISGSDTYPVRRRGTPSGISPKIPPQTKLYKPWENLSFGDEDEEDDPVEEAPVIKRRGTYNVKSTTPRGHSQRSYDDVDAGAARPRGRASQSFAMEAPDSDNEDFDSAPVVRRGGAKPVAVNPPAANNDIPVVTKVQRRGQASQSFVASVPSDDDDDDPEFDAPVVRRRGAGNRQSVPVARSSMGSPQMAWQGENDDDDMGPVRPRRRATPRNDDDDGDFDAPVVRRRGTSSPRPADDSLVVTAVRRRGASQDNQVRPRGSGLPSPQQAGGIPTPTKRSTPSRLRVQDTEVKRRSLPQVPSDSMVQPRGSGSRIRSNSPAGGVVPRTSKLVQPRRGIPTPRATSSYYAAESDQNWQDGCY